MGVFRLVVLGSGVLLLGCATGPGGKGKGIDAIPPLPEGFTLLPSESTGFRSAKVTTAHGKWIINFDDGIIKISPFAYHVVKLDKKWYPEEGGADAALCRGYQRGNEMMIRLEGSSDFVTEETRVFFENNQLREVVKYSIPGQGLGDPDFPPPDIPYDQRVKRQSF